MSQPLDEDRKTSLACPIDMIGLAPPIPGDRAENHETSRALGLKSIGRAQAPKRRRSEIDIDEAARGIEIVRHLSLVPQDAIGQDDVVQTSETADPAIEQPVHLGGVDGGQVQGCDLHPASAPDPQIRRDRFKSVLIARRQKQVGALGGVDSRDSLTNRREATQD